MDLSIIIVNWNTRDLVRECLRSLPAATAGLSTEVMVVDNASADDSVAVITQEFPHVRVLATGANLGFAGGNNRALPLTSGNTILLLNPDTICPPGSLARLFAFARRHENLAAAGPRLVTAEYRPTLSAGFFPRLRDHWFGFLDPRRIWLRGPWSQRITITPRREHPSHTVDYVVGACMLIPRQALEKVGNLDERFFLYFEETDWCYRAHKLGLEVWYCAECEVVHLEGEAAARVSEFSSRQFQISYRAFVAKHYGPWRVGLYRLAQFAEFGAKALLRCLIPTQRQTNRNLARHLWLKARLQLVNKLEAEIPT